MDLVDIIMTVEGEGLDIENYDLMDAIAESRGTLRQLQGSWGRLIAHLEAEELI